MGKPSWVWLPCWSQHILQVLCKNLLWLLFWFPWPFLIAWFDSMAAYMALSICVPTFVLNQLGRFYFCPTLILCTWWIWGPISVWSDVNWRGISVAWLNRGWKSSWGTGKYKQNCCLRLNPLLKFCVPVHGTWPNFDWAKSINWFLGSQVRRLSECGALQLYLKLDWSTAQGGWKIQHGYDEYSDAVKCCKA